MSAWLAAQHGDRVELSKELDNGADMEFKDPMGRTALMEAAKHGHTACVQELLQRGANPNARSAVGKTAQDFCSSHESSHEEIHRLLGEAQQSWQKRNQYPYQQEQQQQQQQQLPSFANFHISDHRDHPNKENTGSLRLHELPRYSSAPDASVVQQAFAIRATAQMELQNRHLTGDSLSPNNRFFQSPQQGLPQQHLASHQNQFQFQPQLQTQSLPQSSPQSQAPMFARQLSQQRSYGSSAENLVSHTYPPPASFTPPNLSPNFPQGLLAQQALARLQKASPEGNTTIPSVNSSINSHRSSEQSNVSTTLSSSLLSNSGSLGSPFMPAQQNPATMSRPVCRYWHSGRCLYGAHCRFAHPAGPAPTPPPSVQPVCRYWRFGTCRYGSACRFRHPMDAAPMVASGQPPNNALSVLQSQLHQQQLARSLGLADAEVLTMILQGQRALQDHST